VPGLYEPIFDATIATTKRNIDARSESSQNPTTLGKRGSPRTWRHPDQRGYEEARAVAAMLADGLTEDGAAQTLGWPKARITARTELLELPERAQQLIGAGAIPLPAVDQLRAIGKVSAGARRAHRVPRQRQ
jgi:hypothetical protein